MRGVFAKNIFFLVFAKKIFRGARRTWAPPPLDGDSSSHCVAVPRRRGVGGGGHPTRSSLRTPQKIFLASTLQYASLRTLREIILMDECTKQICNRISKYERNRINVVSWLRKKVGKPIKKIIILKSRRNRSRSAYSKYSKFETQNSNIHKLLEQSPSPENALDLITIGVFVGEQWIPIESKLSENPLDGGSSSSLLSGLIKSKKTVDFS